jgi:chlorite dismutase
MLWQASEDLDDLHGFAAELQRGRLGAWLNQPYSYLAMTRRSIYVREHTHEGQEGTRLRLMPGGAKYLFVYPFVKTRPWYALDLNERQRIMDEHIRIGHIRSDWTIRSSCWPSRRTSRATSSTW